MILRGNAGDAGRSTRRYEGEYPGSSCLICEQNSTTRGRLGTHSTTHDATDPGSLKEGWLGYDGGHACNYQAQSQIWQVCDAADSVDSSVKPVSGVPKARHDIADLVELLVERAKHDCHFAAFGCLLDCCHTLG